MHAHSKKDKKKRMRDPKELRGFSKLKGLGLNTKGVYAVSYWPTEAMEKNKERFLWRVRQEKGNEYKLQKEIEKLTNKLNDFLELAKKVYPGARFLAVEDELVLVFGHQVGVPTEIGRIYVWGMDVGKLRLREGEGKRTTMKVMDDHLEMLHARD